MDMRLLQQLDHIAEALRVFSERRKVWLLFGFSILYLLSTCMLASRKLMWNDELFTLYIARLPNASDVWSALSTGGEQIPPFFYIVTRGSFYLFGINHLSIRLPEILGFWLMSFCLFCFVVRRLPALYGFVAMLFPLVTQGYNYAYEARPYALVLGFSGLALLCWQSAADGRYRKVSLLGLAVSLAAAISSHYYAVLLFLPLALGEIVRSVFRRRLDLAVWLTFSTAIIPLFFFWPLIERARTSTGIFWAQLHWRSIPEFYYFLLTPALLPLLAMLVLSAIYSTTHPNRADLSAPQLTTTTELHEIVAAFGFIAIPVAAAVMAMFVTHAFTYRYAMPSVIGFSILFAFASYRLLDGRAIMGVALALSLCGGFMTLQIRNFQTMTEIVQDQAETYEFLESEHERELPIVASDVQTFMMLAYYGPRNIVSRLVYLADPEASLHYLGHDSVDRGILDLRDWFGVRIEDYRSYVISQQRFLIYVHAGYLSGQIANFKQIGNFNWLLSAVKADGMQIELRGRVGDKLLFLVSKK
jgi:Dolichyl-phosphate-mannose-protein mannosyltransferase